jgi:hypothetical protein
VAANGNSAIESSHDYLAIGSLYEQSNELRKHGDLNGVLFTEVDYVTERNANVDVNHDVENAAGETRDPVRSQQLTISALPFEFDVRECQQTHSSDYLAFCLLNPASLVKCHAL